MSASPKEPHQLNIVVQISKGYTPEGVTNIAQAIVDRCDIQERAGKVTSAYITGPYGTWVIKDKA